MFPNWKQVKQTCTDRCVLATWLRIPNTLSSWFCCPWLCHFNHGPEILKEKFLEHVVSFQLSVVLNLMIKIHSVLLRCKLSLIQCIPPCTSVSSECPRCRAIELIRSVAEVDQCVATGLTPSKDEDGLLYIYTVQQYSTKNQREPFTMKREGALKTS